MKKILYPTLLFSLLLSSISCEKWNLDKENFVSVVTGALLENTRTSATIQSEIKGLEEGKIIEHGHIYSCVNELLEIGGPDVELSSLGITFDGGVFTNTISELTLNTTYYVRAFALLENEEEPYYGEILEVSLGENNLIVETGPVDFFIGGFEMSGQLSGLQQGVLISKYGFVLSTENDSPTVEMDEVFYLGLLNTDQNFHKRLDNVEPLTTYHYRAFAQLGKEVFYGETWSFFKGDVWTRKANAPYARIGSYATGLGDKGYVGAGDPQPNSFLEYDPISDSWNGLNGPSGVFNFFGAGFSIGETVYTVTGAGNIDNDLWAYDRVEGDWSERAAYPGPLMEFTSVSETIQNKAYIGLGLEIYNPDERIIELWEYDAVEDSWQEISIPFAFGRVANFSFSDEDELFIGFGQVSSDLDLWVYSVNDESWEQRPFDLLTDIFPTGFTSFSMNGKGYFIATTLTDRNVWEYDMERNSWSQRENYPGLQRGDPISFVANEKGYVGFGVNINEQEIVADLWEYTPNKEKL
ncbi:MAG: hypothetical protein AB8F74_10825 [Saprospiraceae bacterium]